MTARREYKEGMDRLRKEQDEALFKVRGEQAVLSEHYVYTIQKLEEEVKKLSRGSTKSLTEETNTMTTNERTVSSPSKEDLRSVSKAVEGRVSEVVKQEVPDTFVEYVPKGVHKGIQVDVESEERAGDAKAKTPVKMVTKGIQVRSQKVITAYPC